MVREFKSSNFHEFQDIVAAYPFSRRITEVHLHHTWRPRQIDYKGLATIEGMWRYHTDNNGWSDIGQHVTVAPDGAIWLCRNFNWAPASASGFNGNRSAGPFMIEMIGDFDAGKECATPEQVKATLSVIKSVQQRFGLEPHHVRFHSEMSAKSCPGNTVDKAAWIAQITDFELDEHRSRGSDLPFPKRATRAYELMRGMNPDAEQSDDMSNAEHDGNHVHSDSDSRGGASGAGELTTIMLDALRNHVVNLERGKLSTSGRLETSECDIDRIFKQLIPQEVDTATAEGRKAQLMFYAHGGLVSEKNALLAAYNQLQFWRSNHIYPIFFVWETGFAETVRQLIAEAGSRSRGDVTRGPLDWVTDNVTDNIIEEISRVTGGRLIWGGMKSSAELASSSGHGAALVAKKTGKLIKRVGEHLDIHVAGHSAGSIFHAHFMPLLIKKKVPIKSVNYLAPAVRNDLFNQKVAPLLGNGIGPLTIFTMSKLHEKKDSVTPHYRKSLLYLVSEAFEDKRKTKILGLEESLRKDKQTRELFGLRGSANGKAEVVWSPNHESNEGSSSAALTHGAFDNDKQTMESVVRRILGRRNGETIQPFPDAAARGLGDFWSDQFNWPEDLEYLSRQAGSLDADDDQHVDKAAAATVSKAGKLNTAVGKSKPAGKTAGYTDKRETAHAGTSQGGNRRALCIGIDEYERFPLAGCVADSTLWKKTLERLGYDVSLLKNGQATAAAIRKSVAELVQSSRNGDSLVLQFAGHGTQFTDADGDEGSGDSPALDECLCAADCDIGEDGLVIDDELRVIINKLPEGVSLTCFFDCCHSGSATRAAGRLAAHASASEDLRSRFLPPSDSMKKAYRNRLKRVRQLASRAAPSTQKDVLFSACMSTELAYESNQQGDFTRRATAVINAGVEGISNRDFLERVLEGFGSNPRQNPQIHCDVRAREFSFLELGTRVSGAAPVQPAIRSSETV